MQDARVPAGSGTAAVVNNEVVYTPPAGRLQPGAAITVEYGAADAQGSASPPR